jgi:hypothetical protein
MSIDVDKMKASWLQAVANGEGLGFARDYMPEILDDLEAAQAKIKELTKDRDALAEDCRQRDYRIARLVEASKKAEAELTALKDIESRREWQRNALKSKEPK